MEALMSGDGKSIPRSCDQKIPPNLANFDSDETFYQRFPELAPFDNGEGFWTAGLNRDVELGEFVEYGRRSLEANSAQQPTEDQSFQAAAQKLLEILNGYGNNAFGRYYLREVLDRSVATKVLAFGGAQFYFPCFPQNTSSAFKDFFSSTAKCNPHNRLSFEETGKFTVTWANHDVVFTEGKNRNICVVERRSYDLTQASRPGHVLVREATSFLYVEPGDQAFNKPNLDRGTIERDPRLVAADLWGIAVDNNWWQEHPAYGETTNVFIWQLGVLRAYLDLR